MALSSTIRSELSDRELSLLAAAFASLASSDRNIDWGKFTQISGYGSVNSARVNFRPIVKKLDAIVENGCNGGVCDGSQSALPKATTAPRAPKAKKKTDTSKTPTKTRGRPKKRKYGDEKAVGGDMQVNPAGVQGVGPGMEEGTADSKCFAGTSRAATAEKAGACLLFAAPENGQDDVQGQAVDASGSTGTYTGPFQNANRLVPASGSNDNNAAAAVVGLQTASEQPESKKLKVDNSSAGPSLKTEEDDLAIAQQLARVAATKTEEDDKQPLTASPGPASIHSITDTMASKDSRFMTLEVDVKSIKVASPEMEISIPFQDQRFSYNESLDFGFEEYPGLEDSI